MKYFIYFNCLNNIKNFVSFPSKEVKLLFDI